MDDGLCLGTLHSVGVYMGHYVVAHQFFPLPGHLVINILLMGLHLVNLFLCDPQPQLFFCLCQGDPKPSPGTEFHVR